MPDTLPKNLSFEEALWVKYAQSFSKRGETELVLSTRELNSLKMSCRREMFDYGDDSEHGRFLGLLLVRDDEA